MSSFPSLRKLAASACILGLAVVVTPAAAAPLTYDFVARVNVLNNALSDTDPVVGLSLGDTVTGSLTYETGLALSPAGSITRADFIASGVAPVAPGDPDQNGFHAGMADAPSETFQAVGGPTFGGPSIFSITLNIAGVTYDYSGDSLLRHRTNEYVPTPDRPTYAYDTLFAAVLDPDGFQSGIRLFDDAVFSGLFPPDQTLAALPDLSELFLARVFTNIDLDGDGVVDTQVFAAVDSLTVRVPEPGAPLLLLAGLIALGAARRLT